VNPLRKLRKVLFYLFLLSYFVICPLLILHVLGYDLQVAGKRALLATGDLYLVSFPPGAQVFVDDKQYPELTPTSVLNLAPGEHQLTLSLQDYIPWIHTVTIEEGKTSVLRDVLLLPQQWQREELNPAVFLDILPISEYPNLLLRQGPRLVDISLYEMEQREVLPLVEKTSPFAELRIDSMVSLVNGSVFLLEARQGSSGVRLLVTIQSGHITVQDLSGLIPEGIGSLEWAAENARDLFFYRGGSVTRINVPRTRTSPAFPYRLRGFGIHNGNLYFLTLDGGLLSLDYDAANVRSLDGYDSIISLLPATGFIKVIPRPNGVMIFRGQNGELVISGLGKPMALERIKGYREHPEPSQLLLWQDRRLAVLHLGPGGASGRGAAAVPDLQWLPVSGINVEQAFFVLEGTHILFRDGARVLLLGPDREGERRKFPVADIRRGTSLYYSDRLGRLYFIDSLTGRLSSLQIIEKTQFTDQLLLDLRKRLPP
jgi:hypothetical protein